jgi:hypothetical protein
VTLGLTPRLGRDGSDHRRPQRNQLGHYLGHRLPLLLAVAAQALGDLLKDGRERRIVQASRS